MSNQAKTVIGLVIVVVLALAAFVLMGPIIGLGIAVVGGLALWVVLERTGDGFELPTRRRADAEDDDDLDVGETRSGGLQPLSTWSPPDTLTPWTPPADAPAPPADPTSTGGTAAPRVDDDFWSPGPPRDDFSDLTTPTDGEPTSWLDESAHAESTWGTDTTWDDGSSWDATTVPADANPLDDLARLDEIDVIAEFERLDEHEVPPASPAPSGSMFDVPAPATTGSMFDVPAPAREVLSPINEAVSSADDIMAASQATELHVEQEDNSELAKLLAKVQARLAAYE